MYLAPADWLYDMCCLVRNRAGVNLPRSKAADGSPLPSARQVSITFTQDIDSPSENYTMLLMQWGQFLDHDMTHTPISRGQMGSGISCCRNGREIDASLRHPDCFQIEIPRNDHMFAPFGERCMEFVRSLPAPRPECNFGPREQVWPSRNKYQFILYLQPNMYLINYDYYRFEIKLCVRVNSNYWIFFFFFSLLINDYFFQ